MRTFELGKHMDQDIKNRFKIYGDSVYASLYTTLSDYHKIYMHKNYRISQYNKLTLFALIRNNINYIVSYYIKGSQTDSCEDFEMRTLWRKYSRSLTVKLNKRKINNKLKTAIVVDLLLVIISRICIDNEGDLDHFIFNEDEDMLTTIERIIDKIGYTSFIQELFAQAFIFSILKHIIQVKPSTDIQDHLINMNLVVTQAMTYNAIHLYSSTLNNNVIFNKICSQKIIEFDYKHNENFKFLIEEIINPEYNMIDSMVNVKVFLEAINNYRIYTKDITLDDFKQLEINIKKTKERWNI